PKIENSIANLEKKLAAGQSTTEENGGLSHQRRGYLSRRLEELKIVRNLVAQLLDTTPESTTDQERLLAAAARFLQESARLADKPDSFAGERLILEIQDMRRWLERISEPSELDIWEWLFSLPGEAQIMGSGPREGRLHVASVFTGGHSGRPYTFIVGMD